jgi:hypothetical protein
MNELNSIALYLFFGFHHLTAAIIAALGTCLMWQFALQTLRANTRCYYLKKIMRAALASA